VTRDGTVSLRLRRCRSRVQVLVTFDALGQRTLAQLVQHRARAAVRPARFHGVRFHGVGFDAAQFQRAGRRVRPARSGVGIRRH
jgi:hypothetical protein